MFKVASESLKRNGRSLCAHISDALAVSRRLVLWLPSVPARLSMSCWLLRKNEVQSSMVVETGPTLVCYVRLCNTYKKKMFATHLIN